MKSRLLLAFSTTLLFFAPAFPGCKKKESPVMTVKPGPSGLTTSTHVDVDDDGTFDFEVMILPQPHSTSLVKLSCLNGFKLETMLTNDTLFMSRSTTIPDINKKEKFYTKTFTCVRRGIGDSVTSILPSAAHLVVYNNIRKEYKKMNFSDGTFTLFENDSRTTEFPTTSNDTTYYRVTVTAMDCRTKIPVEDPFYLVFRTKGEKSGWLKIRVKDAGHVVDIPEIALGS